MTDTKASTRTRWDSVTDEHGVNLTAQMDSDESGTRTFSFGVYSIANGGEGMRMREADAEQLYLFLGAALGRGDAAEQLDAVRALVATEEAKVRDWLKFHPADEGVLHPSVETYDLREIIGK